MHTINVFEDKDGDYVVTDAAKVAPGITAWQINGESAREVGGAIKALESMPSFILWINKGQLGSDTASVIAKLKHKLVESVESEKLSEALRSGL